MSRAVRSLLAALLLPAALAGCGSDGSSGGGEVDGDVLRIYSSQPLRGALSAQAQAIVRGERLALADAGGRVGEWRIDYRALNDADAKTGTWDPGLVSANAREAAQDDKTIAYLGETGTGASAVSIPILNETGILDVSPTDTVTGFTREKGANPGEPDKYFPTRDENFARLVPPDDVQAAALLQLMQDEKATRLFVVQDQKLYGQGLANAIVRDARGKGVEVVKGQAIDPDDVDIPKLASEVGASGADAFLYSGEIAPTVAPLLGAVAQAAPKAKLFLPSALCDDAFVGRLGAAGPRTLCTAPWLALRSYPPEARQVAARYRDRYGAPMPPQALYGYEAMSAVLDAIRRADDKGNDRGEVIDEMLATRNRKSVLGTYSIRNTGDVTIQVYGAWQVRDGRLAFLRVLDPFGA
jgi:branched-chain amino acid transport system substrate-binding protein